MAARLPHLLLLVALVLSALGGFAAWRSDTASDPPFRIDRPDRNLGEMTAGPRTVTFRITNPADIPRRIIGLADE
jgi:hypothetical protein